MAASPPWKVYRDGEYVASLRYPEDAAALVALSGGSVRYGHGNVVYEDTPGRRAIAENSYDEAAEIMVAKLRAINARGWARSYGGPNIQRVTRRKR